MEKTIYISAAVEILKYIGKKSYSKMDIMHGIRKSYTGVTSAVKFLHEYKMVTIKQNPKLKRALLVTVTPKGELFAKMFSQNGKPKTFN